MAEKERPVRRTEKAEVPPAEPEAKVAPVVPQIESGSLVTSAALIGLATLIEEELLVGMLVGAGIMFASGWVSALLGAVVRPVVKTTVKAGYVAAEKTGEVVSGASERIGSLFSGAPSEEEGKQAAAS